MLNLNFIHKIRKIIKFEFYNFLEFSRIELKRETQVKIRIQNQKRTPQKDLRKNAPKLTPAPLNTDFTLPLFFFLCCCPFCVFFYFVFTLSRDTTL